MAGEETDHWSREILISPGETLAPGDSSQKQIPIPIKKK